MKGNPGCSSLLSLLTENGPFHVNPDGKTLFENVFAWNKQANVLYLEGPVGVGFSYSTDPNATAASSTWQGLVDTSVLALLDFLTAYPEYTNRPLYLGGDYYAGLFVPALGRQLARGIAQGSMPGLNLTGLMVGNGLFSESYRLNSAIALLYHRGLIGKPDWDWLWSNCCSGNVSYAQAALCDFSQNTRGIGYNQDCIGKVNSISELAGAIGSVPGGVYNIFQV